MQTIGAAPNPRDGQRRRFGAIGAVFGATLLVLRGSAIATLLLCPAGAETDARLPRGGGI